MAYEEPTSRRLISNFESSIRQALSYVDDPTSIEKRQVVYMREPDTAADDFDGYPYVYLEDYSVTTEDKTLNGDIADVPAVVTLVIDAEDEDVESKKHHDALSDQVIHIFKTKEERSLNEVKWADVEIDTNERTTTVELTGKPIVRRTITFSMTAEVDFSDES